MLSFSWNNNNAPINGLPQDGRVGQPKGNLTFSGFQMSISPPLGHCYKSNSHPRGPQIVILVDTHLQRRIIKKLTQKYQKVRLLFKTLLVIVWWDLASFLDSFVCHTRNSIYATFIQRCISKSIGIGNIENFGRVESSEGMYNVSRK